MKLLPLFLSLLVSPFAHAQNSLTNEVRLTETSFALESQISGLRTGFLKYLDTSAIGINKNGFINLFSVWMNRADAKAVLLWEPKTVYSTSDGLTGVTHGPYYTLDSALNTLMNTGFFFTVWERKSRDKPYKIILDAGVRLNKPEPKESGVSLQLKEAMIPVAPEKGKWLNDTSFLHAFAENARIHSLYQALNTFAEPYSDILLQGSGRLSKTQLANKNLEVPYQFKKTSRKLLSNGSVHLDYGELQAVLTSAKGYYVHLWAVMENQPRLLAAVYRFN